MKHILAGLFLFVGCGMNSLMAETTITRDTLILTADSIYVIETACAPICSSVVRLINSKGNMLQTLPCPFPHAVFPEAYFEGKEIKWRDNTPELLDEDEKKIYS